MVHNYVNIYTFFLRKLGHILHLPHHPSSNHDLYPDIHQVADFSLAWQTAGALVSLVPLSPTPLPTTVLSSLVTKWVVGRLVPPRFLYVHIWHIHWHHWKDVWSVVIIG